MLRVKKTAPAATWVARNTTTTPLAGTLVAGLARRSSAMTQ
jgi:hypothetical protein